MHRWFFIVSAFLIHMGIASHLRSQPPTVTVDGHITTFEYPHGYWDVGALATDVDRDLGLGFALSRDLQDPLVVFDLDTGEAIERWALSEISDDRRALLHCDSSLRTLVIGGNIYGEPSPSSIITLPYGAENASGEVLNRDEMVIHSLLASDETATMAGVLLYDSERRLAFAALTDERLVAIDVTTGAIVDTVETPPDSSLMYHESETDLLTLICEGVDHDQITFVCASGEAPNIFGAQVGPLSLTAGTEVGDPYPFPLGRSVRFENTVFFPFYTTGTSYPLVTAINLGSGEAIGTYGPFYGDEQLWLAADNSSLLVGDGGVLGDSSSLINPRVRRIPFNLASPEVFAEMSDDHRIYLERHPSYEPELSGSTRIRYADPVRDLMIAEVYGGNLHCYRLSDLALLGFLSEPTSSMHPVHRVTSDALISGPDQIIPIRDPLEDTWSEPPICFPDNDSLMPEDEMLLSGDGSQILLRDARLLEICAVDTVTGQIAQRLDDPTTHSTHVTRDRDRLITFNPLSIRQFDPSEPNGVRSQIWDQSIAPSVPFPFNQSGFLPGLGELDLVWIRNNLMAGFDAESETFRAVTLPTDVPGSGFLTPIMFSEDGLRLLVQATYATMVLSLDSATPGGLASAEIAACNLNEFIPSELQATHFANHLSCSVSPGGRYLVFINYGRVVFPDKADSIELFCVDIDTWSLVQQVSVIPPSDYNEEDTLSRIFFTPDDLNLCILFQNWDGPSLAVLPFQETLPEPVQTPSLHIPLDRGSELTAPYWLSRQQVTHFRDDTLYIQCGSQMNLICWTRWRRLQTISMPEHVEMGALSEDGCTAYAFDSQDHTYHLHRIELQRRRRPVNVVQDWLLEDCEFTQDELSDADVNQSGSPDIADLVSLINAGEVSGDPIVP